MELAPHCFSQPASILWSRSSVYAVCLCVIHAAIQVLPSSWCRYQVWLFCSAHQGRLGSADVHWLLNLPSIGLLSQEARENANCQWAAKAIGSALLQCRAIWERGTALPPTVPLPMQQEMGFGEQVPPDYYQLFIIGLLQHKAVKNEICQCLPAAKSTWNRRELGRWELPLGR